MNTRSDRRAREMFIELSEDESLIVKASRKVVQCTTQSTEGLAIQRSKGQYELGQNGKLSVLRPRTADPLADKP